MTLPDGLRNRLASLGQLQEAYSLPVSDAATESPRLALTSLDNAVAKAPGEYAPYLHEAVVCYEHGLYRAAILMVWAAVVEHLYLTVDGHAGGISALQAANLTRFGKAKNYREVKKKDDFLYLGESNWLLIAEDAGLLNRNARDLLTDRLKLRNRCGHPTGYTPGREETVVFIESLILNVLSGAMLNW